LSHFTGQRRSISLIISASGEPQVDKQRIVYYIVYMAPRKPKKTKTALTSLLTIRVSAADRELLARIQAKTGVRALAEITRQGWRLLAEKEKV
jgi:hypothetical protein